MAEAAAQVTTPPDKSQQGSTQTESAGIQAEEVPRTNLQRQREEQEAIQQRLLEQTDDAKVVNETLKLTIGSKKFELSRINFLSLMNYSV